MAVWLGSVTKADGSRPVLSHAVGMNIMVSENTVLVTSYRVKMAEILLLQCLMKARHRIE